MEHPSTEDEDPPVGITVEQYYGVVHNLGLRPTNVPTVYRSSSSGKFFNVPAPYEMTPEQRAETLEMLKRQFGIGWRND